MVTNLSYTTGSARDNSSTSAYPVCKWPLHICWVRRPEVTEKTESVLEKPPDCLEGCKYTGAPSLD